MPISTQIRRAGQPITLDHPWSVWDLITLAGWMAQERGQHEYDPAPLGDEHVHQSGGEGCDHGPCKACGQLYNAGPHDTPSFPRNGSYTFLEPHTASTPAYLLSSEGGTGLVTLSVQPGDIYSAYR